jgi:hypothetical protein
MLEAAQAVRDALTRHPDGLTYRGLLASVREQLRQCSEPRLDAAIAYLAGEIVTSAGPRGATIHCLTRAA